MSLTWGASRRWRSVVAATTALLLAVAGCTSGDDGAGSPDAAEAGTGGVSAEEAGTFAAAYTEASADFEAEVAAVKARGRAALQAGDDGEVVRVYRELLEATRAAHRRYAELEPPDGLDVPLDEARDQLEAQVELLGTILEAVEADDEPAVTAGLEELASLMVDWANTHRAMMRKLSPDEA